MKISTKGRFWLLLLIGTLLAIPGVKAQTTSQGLQSLTLDYNNPQSYVLGGISVSGNSYIDKSVVIMLSDLQVGNTYKIPGDAISSAIRKLWKQGLFDDIRIYATKIVNDTIYLNIYLDEKPRLAKYSFSGIRKSAQSDLKDKINLTRGDVVTNHLIKRTERIIKDYYRGKGFLNTDVNITQSKAGSRIGKSHLVNLDIHIKRNRKVKISQIKVFGNKAFSAEQVKKAMKNTKEMGRLRPLRPLGPLVVNAAKDIFTLHFHKLSNQVLEYFLKNYNPRIFKASKFVKSKFDDDLASIVDSYNKKGYRDAQVVSDSVYKTGDNRLGVNLHIYEGPKYYYRKITWVGNTVYPSKFLSEVLGIKPGDVYNKKLLNTNLDYNDKGYDVSSLYMNNGYLFFSATPVETYVGNDSIDLEIRIHEGKQARINKVTISGNTKTNDHVALREIRTMPGQLFNRELVIRSVRELANLKYFNPQTIKPEIRPDPQNGTVNINYKVEEQSADQIELSGGWGYGSIIGTIGLSFNNFSLKNVFNKKAWRPIPSGDGQKLSLHFQTYGPGYLNWNVSFTEPWLGGRKPNALTVSYFHSIFRSTTYNGTSYVTLPSSFATDGFSIGLGKRLTWPDDFFTLQQSINVQLYKLNNYASIFAIGNGNGRYNNIAYNIALGRNSISQFIYPQSGSKVSFSLMLTPPYSLFSKNKNFSTMTDQEKYRWIEYYKWKFKGDWYLPIVGKLILHPAVRFGFLGAYNKQLGVTPFERFYLGGSGLSGFYNYDGREIIAMRGYADQSITPDYYKNQNTGGTIFAKYTLELRYPISLAQSSTIYVQAFFEAGNDWLGTNNLDPFNVKRTAGIGARIYLPMFGLLGLDWGYGFDPIPGIPSASGSHFAFSMNNSLD